MEPLIALLFIVFSIGSALLERRKRKQQVEQGRKAFQEREARRQAEEQQQGESKRFEVEEEEEEPEWFPTGGLDPFELEPPKPAKPDPALVEIERQQQEAERKAQQLEAQIQRLKKERQEEQAQYPKRKRSPRRIGRLVFDPRAVRDAIVYAEIIGPPISERKEEH